MDATVWIFLPKFMSGPKNNSHSIKINIQNNHLNHEGFALSNVTKAFMKLKEAPCFSVCYLFLHVRACQWEGTISLAESKPLPGIQSWTFQHLEH